MIESPQLFVVEFISSYTEQRTCPAARSAAHYAAAASPASTACEPGAPCDHPPSGESEIADTAETQEKRISRVLHIFCLKAAGRSPPAAPGPRQVCGRRYCLGKAPPARSGRSRAGICWGSMHIMIR